MSNYGIQPTGYVRKPISVILAELEAAMATEFGPGVIQTPQSPLGQLNGLMADLIAEVDERNLDLYQSYDPDQAEGFRLDTLARLRLIYREGQTDLQLRQAITNAGQGRIDIQDLARALTSVPGVTYAQVFVNESGEVSSEELERGFVAAVVIGGDDEDIARVMRRYIVPGVNTYGNTYVTSNVDGFCRSLSIVRPSEVPVDVEIVVRLSRDRSNCPPPSALAVKNVLEAGWMAQRVNGKDVNAYTLRTIIEGAFSNVELVSFTASRDGADLLPADVNVGFMEIASLNVEVIAL
jgi:hypothetical protein